MHIIKISVLSVSLFSLSLVHASRRPLEGAEIKKIFPEISLVRFPNGKVIDYQGELRNAQMLMLRDLPNPDTGLMKQHEEYVTFQTPGTVKLVHVMSEAQANDAKYLVKRCHFTEYQREWRYAQALVLRARLDAQEKGHARQMQESDQRYEMCDQQRNAAVQSNQQLTQMLFDAQQQNKELQARLQELHPGSFCSIN